MMAVEAEDAAQQLGAEAVHHRHDDDERGDAERDAEQREDGDDGDEALLAPRAQIAERDHALERAEDHRVAPSRARAAFGGKLLALAGAALLQLDHARCEPARADDDLPGQADQVHRRELGAGRFLAVVVERVDAGRAERAIERIRGRAAFGVGRRAD